ncbi:MAG: NHLP bacteriocin system secretion protein [Verrucomicrobia bacterium]|nr:NHLP bacteriocin system secretion protein [Verrucomicrobiota bacterium]
MEPQSRIFRQSALDKLSSPEQLDQLMQVTTPKSWLALAACAALVLTAIAWSIFGSIPTTVSGRGILIKESGVFVVTSHGEGRVEKLRVEVGQKVKAGDSIARVKQAERDLKINQARFSLDKLKKELDDLVKFQEEEVQKEQADLERQRALYQTMLHDYGEQMKAIQARIQVQQQKRELFSATQLLELTNSLYAAQHDANRANIQLRQLDLNQLQADERRRQQKREKELQQLQAQEQLDSLVQLDGLNDLKSPFDGTVLETMVKPNQLISASTPILSLQADAEELEAHLFLHPADGKLVTRGKEAAVSPVSVKKEEAGFMKGTVKSVAQFPATPQGMLGILENPALVNDFSEGGAPIRVVVQLKRAPENPEAFLWSNKKGPREVKISSGTLCEGTITLRVQTPISLLLPIFKSRSGE